MALSGHNFGNPLLALAVIGELEKKEPKVVCRSCAKSVCNTWNRMITVNKYFRNSHNDFG